MVSPLRRATAEARRALVVCAWFTVACSTDRGGGPAWQSATTGLVAGHATDGSPPGATTSGAGDSGSAGDSTGCAFVCPDHPVPSECSLFAQDCGPGRKCVAFGSSEEVYTATKCVTVAPKPAAAGERCTAQGSPWSGVDDCDASSMCRVLDEQTLEGVCLEFCLGGIFSDPYCPDPADVCPTSVDVVPLCYHTCDPLADDCGSGNGCYFRPEIGLVCLPDFSGQAGGAGTPCDASFQCDPGYVCVGADYLLDCNSTAGCCSPFCSLSDPGFTCPGDPYEICQPFYLSGHAPAGQEDVGLCLLQ